MTSIDPINYGQNNQVSHPTEEVTRVMCERCGAYIEHCPGQGGSKPLIDWRTRDEQLCHSPPWPRCENFIDAYVAYVSDHDRRTNTHRA
jgi:hypothetical protein